MKCVYIFFLSIFVVSIPAETHFLNTADTAPYSTQDNDGFYDVLLTEVFNNMDLELKINHYPSKRSILWANEGHDDGEFARIKGLSETYTNLIEIEEPLVIFNFVAVKKEGNPLNPSSWDDLKDLRTGYLRGWKIYETNIGIGHKINIVADIDHLFNMLIEDRLDIILYSKLRAEEYITEHNIKGLEIIDPPLSKRTMHLYMHKKNERLTPLISREILNMKTSGRYVQLFERYFN